MKYFKKFTYYQKLIIILLVLTLTFIIPYALILYNSSKDKILESIQYSNDQSLTQIKYNYTTYNDMMTNLCFSIFFNNETQHLLYNDNITYQKSNTQISYLKSTVLNIYPSVYSISIYNGTEQKLYSTLIDSSNYFTDLNNYMKNTPNTPRLQPILRKIPHIYQDSYIYVFSYILYDFETSDNRPYSYIILEQNANWLIENFREISHLNENLPSRIYLLDQDGNICSEDIKYISDIDRKLLKEHFTTQNANLSTDSSYYYIYPFEGEKYLITSLQLNQNGDSLVMLQDYDDVFSSLESFRVTFQIILMVWIILLILVIWGISKGLYMPIKNTLSYIGELSGNSIMEGNEFQQLRILYKDSYDKMTKHEHITQHTLKQYQLENLLTDSSPSALKNFSIFAPKHWLSAPVDGYLRVFLLTVNRGAGAKNSLSEEDFNLFLFTIQNILTELLEEEGNAEVFIASNFHIWGILQTCNTDYDMVLEDVVGKTRYILQKYIHLPLDVTYSRPIKDILQLNTLYYEILSLHDYHYIFGPDAVISPLTCQKNICNNTNHIMKNLQKKCLAALKCDHINDAIETIHLIFDSLHEMKYDHAQINVMAFTNQINFVLNEMCISKNITASINFEQIYHQLNHAQYLEDIETSLIQYLKDSMNIFLEKKEDAKQQLFVEKIKEYIKLNYSDPNLSSQMLSAYMKLSAKYVMKKFQDCSGISLTDYITDIRMRQAAAILKNSNQSISKVAEQVGILNENYFYKLFKKTYGCTPREFSSNNSKDIEEKS